MRPPMTCHPNARTEVIGVVDLAGQYQERRISSCVAPGFRLIGYGTVADVLVGSGFFNLTGVMFISGICVAVSVGRGVAVGSGVRVLVGIGVGLAVWVGVGGSSTVLKMRGVDRMMVG